MTTVRRVLITGFQPFGGEEQNPSWMLASALAGLQTIQDTTVEVVATELPTVFGVSSQRLRAVISERRPEVVLCLGQAGGRTALTPERVAINVDDARIADNDGQQPVDVPVVPGGPAAYFSSLPIKRMVRDMRAAGIPAEVSQTAGTFVCNHVFYALMHMAATEFPFIWRCGFMHVPYLPIQVLGRSSPSMSFQLMKQGIEAALPAILSPIADAPLAGGQEQ